MLHFCHVCRKADADTLPVAVAGSTGPALFLAADRTDPREWQTRYVQGMQSRGLSDPAAGAGELDRFVAVGGAELGGC